MILLDTHTAIWFASDNPALGPASRVIADRALSEGQLAVSAIVFWELALLIAKRRFESRHPAPVSREQSLATGVGEVPLSGDIAILSVELSGLHGDPADRIMVATAMIHGATLVTADRHLLAWQHPLPRRNAAA